MLYACVCIVYILKMTSSSSVWGCVCLSFCFSRHYNVCVVYCGWDVGWEYCVTKNCGRTIKGNGGDIFGYVFGEKCSLQQVKCCDALKKGVIVFFLLFHLSLYVQSNIVIYSLFLCN